MVCEAVGMGIKGVLLGSEIENMTDDALMAAAESVNVFARVSPVQKERIISILREDGHVVGYLGDGINDASALRDADVGHLGGHGGGRGQGVGRHHPAGCTTPGWVRSRPAGRNGKNADAPPIIMITGDASRTAVAIAKQIGLVQGTPVETPLGSRN
jgi:magnesium-transporting ATPase (P-type)